MVHQQRLPRFLASTSKMMARELILTIALTLIPAIDSPNIWEICPSAFMDFISTGLDEPMADFDAAVSVLLVLGDGSPAYKTM